MQRVIVAITLIFALAQGQCELNNIGVPSGMFNASLTQQSGATITFDFCSTFTCGQSTAVGACNLGNDGLRYAAGSGPVLTSTGTKNVYNVVFSGGAACLEVSRATHVQLTCDPDVFGLAIDSAVESPQCTYLVTGRTRDVCDGSPPPSPSCQYAADGNSYDLSGTPMLQFTSSGPTPYQYNVSVCGQLPCGAEHAALCQQTPEGLQVSLGAESTRQTSGTRYAATVKFSQGTMCAGGVNSRRRSQVTVNCGRETAVQAVTESPQCSYHVTMSSPKACPPFRKK